jgi:hypothetical protein
MREGNKISCEYTQDYASIVHDMPISYNYSTPNTQPNFLGQPFQRASDDIQNRIKKALS